MPPAVVNEDSDDDLPVDHPLSSRSHGTHAVGSNDDDVDEGPDLQDPDDEEPEDEDDQLELLDPSMLKNTLLAEVGIFTLQFIITLNS